MKETPKKDIRPESKPRGQDKPSAPAEESKAPTSEPSLPKGEIEKRTKDLERFHKLSQELERTLDVTRRDLAAQKAERLIEVRTLNAVIQKSHAREKSAEEEIGQLRQSNKQLKAQNLTLQYHLNRWGTPVSLNYASNDLEESSASSFFPPLSPIAGGEDPIPTVLKGELAPFGFPNLFLFLANSHLQGVLTVVTDGIVSKLYLEKGALQLAGWNNRDPELGLFALLKETDLIPTADLQEARGFARFDLELAHFLLSKRNTAPQTLQAGLREHARVILGFLFHLIHGAFYFQPGQIVRWRDLQFRLLVKDILLKTAAEMDEKTRTGLIKT